METTWILLIVSFGLWLTKAGDLGAPYRIASIFFLLLQDVYGGVVMWVTFISIMLAVDYMCARYYVYRTDEFSQLLYKLLIAGIGVHALFGVDVATGWNLVYDSYDMYMDTLNWMQIVVLISGGYSAGLVDRDWYLDKYSGTMAGKELMVAYFRNRLRTGGI